MRKDIENELLKYGMEVNLLNKSELARRMNCSRQTIDAKLKKVNNNIAIYDPLVKNKSIKLLEEVEFEKYISKADIVILACAHEAFLRIDYTKYKNIKYILDCWNKLDKNKIISSGKKYIGVGE